MNETRPTPETIRAYFEHRRRRALRVCAVGAAVAVIAIVPIAVGYVLTGAVGAVPEQLPPSSGIPSTSVPTAELTSTHRARRWRPPPPRCHVRQVSTRAP